MAYSTYFDLQGRGIDIFHAYDRINRNDMTRVKMVQHVLGHEAAAARRGR